MANKKFKLALQKNIDNFKNEYLCISREQFTNDDGTLIHSGEFGIEREKICKGLFEKFCASHVSLSSGFVINANEGISTQQDLIFYDKKNTPILNIDDERFFPIETVVCIGQVKSVIQSKQDLKTALLNLVEIKKMREQITNPGITKSANKAPTGGGVISYKPELFAYDQIFTFLVCEKFSFEITPEEIDELYPVDLPARYKHNNILNIEAGIYQYTSGKFAFLYPELPLEQGGILKPRFNSNLDGYNHILHILQNISLATQGTTILHVELGDYYFITP